MNYHKPENDAILLRVRGFVSANLVMPDGLEAPRDDDSLLERGIIDSTGVVELVMFIEESFEIEVADEEVIPDNLDSISRVAAYIGRKLNHAG